ncbi:DUF4232 domain-containing protein [Streptomyces sp. NPDC098789]|uniref:DUF4232 domain-containing protein n=1 Tax=Streptomyces sp. NPDC098789 TaxID=3366098 RepID=UPI00382E83CB
MRTYRKTTRARTFGALGLAAAALLATTACGPGGTKAGTAQSPTSSASPSASSSTTAPSPSAPQAPASSSAKPSTKPSASASSPGRPGEAEGDSKGIDGNCSDEDTRVTVEWAVPPVKDDSKLLLTVTNVGTGPCKLRSYPVLRLENGHGRLVGVFTGSKPQTEVTLAPGKQAYAGLLLRQGNKETATLVTDMALAPHGQSPTADTGEGLLLQMPKGGVYVDDKARVTYWHGSSEAAASPLFAH